MQDLNLDCAYDHSCAPLRVTFNGQYLGRVESACPSG